MFSKFNIRGGAFPKNERGTEYHSEKCCAIIHWFP
jgi:hypothetical protein